MFQRWKNKGKYQKYLKNCRLNGKQGDTVQSKTNSITFNKKSYCGVKNKFSAHVNSKSICRTRKGYGEIKKYCNSSVYVTISPCYCCCIDGRIKFALAACNKLLFICQIARIVKSLRLCWKYAILSFPRNSVSQRKHCICEGATAT